MNSQDLNAVTHSAGELVDAVWMAYAENRRDLKNSIASLFDHEDPVVREEVLSLLLVKWREKEFRGDAIRALTMDTDYGVRSTAALALVSVSTPDTRTADVATWLRVLKDETEDVRVRRTCYESLLILAGRHDFPPDIQNFSVENDVDWSWINEIAIGRVSWRP